MRVAIVTSEAIPYSKTGGLADVTGTLYKEYKRLGIDVYLFLPLYKKTYIEFREHIEDTRIQIDVPVGGVLRKCTLYTLSGDKKVYFLGNNDFFWRDELYATSIGDYADNDERFIFFSRGVIEALKRLNLDMDIIHCNDWQTALIPLYIKTIYKGDSIFSKTKSVLTIHNLGYQGIFPPDVLQKAGLGWQLFHMDGVEFYGKINFLKAGIISADIITTVSMTYAKEMLNSELGFGLNGILRKRQKDLVGILNGIDYEEWDPSKDRYLPYNFNKEDLSGKYECKAILLKKCNLEDDPRRPVLSFIGRLSEQKGIDLLVEAIPHIINRGANIIIVGKGEEKYKSLIDKGKEKYHSRLFFYSEFDESFAHIVYAGSDIFMMPSKYEPCGLGQMIAMRYGTIPIARKTGGLADTIEDGVTGFLFEHYSSKAFIDKIREAIDFYDDEIHWRRLIKNAMSMDFSWNKSAKRYMEIYNELILR